MTRPVPGWMPAVLLAAGVYNLIWGAWVVFAPTLSFGLSGLDRPGVPLAYPQLWQCIGMIVGVYGVGYACAALDPVRHWPVVLVGFLGKLFGPMGYVYGVIVGQTRPEAIATILFNDLIWWVPFYLILRRAYRAYRDEEDRPPAERPEAAARAAKDAFGVSLDELSRRSPVLVVFLRHLGCTYCREAAADLATQRATIEANGTRLVLVHTATPAAMDAFCERYTLADVPRIADPDGRLYRAFGLRRGSPWELFGPKTVGRFVSAGVFAGHGVGSLEGDGTRMPGAFLLRDGRIVRAYRHASAADRPDYCAIADRTPDPLLAGLPTFPAEVP